MLNSKINVKITNKNGNEIDYHVLCTFDSKQTKKSYMIFTDFSSNSSHAFYVYYAYYEKNNYSLLKPIQTQEEITLLNNIVSSLEQELPIRFIKPTFPNS
ncbi:MAG: DUF1292 domain-containing protein [Clostridia bacterium]|nr:DUF1292 domain-containing protein [Clostridia bacterium]